MSVIPAGEYNLKFNVAPVYGMSANGNDYLQGSMVVVGGQHDGFSISYLGMFDEKNPESMKRTAQHLQAAGWDLNLADFTSVVGKVVPGKVGVEPASGSFSERNRVQWLGKKASAFITQDKLAAKANALAALGLAAPVKQQVEEPIPF